MHYESMHGAHYVVPGKECNIQIMLIHTSEITTSKYKFLFLLFFFQSRLLLWMKPEILRFIF